MGSLIVLLIVLGLIGYAISLLPIEEPFKKLINVVLIIIAVLAVLRAFGLITTGWGITNNI